MIDWIDDLGKDWGRRLRKAPTGYPRRSVTGRIMDEGDVGAAIRAHIEILPVKFMAADVLEFHRAWEVQRSKYRKLLYVHYAAIAAISVKLDFMDMKRSTYYSNLDQAQTELWSTIELQNRVQKVQQVQN